MSAKHEKPQRDPLFMYIHFGFIGLCVIAWAITSAFTPQTEAEKAFDRSCDKAFNWCIVLFLIACVLALVAWAVWMFPWEFLKGLGLVACLPVIAWLAKLDRKLGEK